MLRRSLGVAIDMVRLLEGPRTLSGVRREVVSSNQGLLLWARDNAPACEECLFPLRVSSEDASASARLSSRRLDECSRYLVFAYTSSLMCCLSASQCTSLWTTVQRRESEKDWLHSGLLPGRTLPIEFAWTRGISIVNRPWISSPLTIMWSVTAQGAACQPVSVRVRGGGEWCPRRSDNRV